MGAAYEATISMTDDETFLFTVEPRTAAGAAPAWAEFTFEYSLIGCGNDLDLTEGSGLTIDEAEDTVTIGPVDRTTRLRCGQYRHGLRMTEIASGITTQLFDGTVTVTQGNFR